jgi:hypothetical protein
MNALEPDLKKYLQTQARQGGEQGLCAQQLIEKYSDDESRDNQGRWSSGGDGGDALDYVRQNHEAGVSVSSSDEHDEMANALDNLASEHEYEAKEQLDAGHKFAAQAHTTAAKKAKIAAGREWAASSWLSDNESEDGDSAYLSDAKLDSTWSGREAALKASDKALLISAQFRK